MNKQFRTRRSAAFLLNCILVLIVGMQVSTASATSRESVKAMAVEDEEKLRHRALETAEKLQRLAWELLGKEWLEEEMGKSHSVSDIQLTDRNLLQGRLGKDGISKAASDYTSIFPDSYRSFYHVFGRYGTADTYWDDGSNPYWVEGQVEVDGPLYSYAINVYIELFFDLYEYSDKPDFIRRAANITIGAGWRGDDGEIGSIYERQLLHHFNTYFDDYLKHLSHDREAVTALLRFFTLDAHNHMKGEEGFNHRVVSWGVGELCLSYILAMRLCAATDLIEVPLFDDIVAVLECGDRIDADCAHAAKGGPFQAKLADWAKSNLHLVGPAFKPGSKEARNYLPVFYMARRYLSDEFPVLPLLEAKLYLNHPKLSMRWLDFHQRDFEKAKDLGKDLLSVPGCMGNHPQGRLGLAKEAKRLGKALATRYREYLSVGESSFWSHHVSSTYRYRVDQPLFTNRFDVKKLLKHWEAASSSNQEIPVVYCEQQKRLQQREQ